MKCGLEVIPAIVCWVWSNEGPVPFVAVAPDIRIQSKLSPAFKLVQVHSPLSKSQFPGKTEKKTQEINQQNMKAALCCVKYK